MIGLRERKSLGLALLGSLILGCIFFFAVHEPLLAEIAAAEAQIAQLNREEIALENFIKNHPNRGDYLNELKARQDYVASLLPENMEPGDFIALLQQKAVANKVSIMGINPGEEYQEKNYCCLPWEISVEGDYFSLLDYLLQLPYTNYFQELRYVSKAAKIPIPL